jgi:hypothetical protein
MVFHRRIHANRNRRFKSYHLRYASRTYRQYQVAVKLPGSFRLAAGNRHLHRYCIFTERVSETVAQTLHYSTRRNLPDKELRYLRTIIVIADIHQGLYQSASPCLAAERNRRYLTFWHWSSVTPYTSSYELAGSCVFVKQLPGRL